MNTVLRTHTFPSGQHFDLVQGDLLQEPVEAIVNAANRHLSHGGGVAGQIARAGGPQVQAESDAWVRQHGPVSHASPAYTGAGRLPFRQIIHAVGPVWGEGDEDNRLAAAVTGSVETAERLGMASLALPAISTGIFGFPEARAAGVIFQAVEAYFTQHTGSALSQVRLVLYQPGSAQVFLDAWRW